MYKSKEERKEGIKKYVIQHPSCSKEEVIKYLDGKGIGSKVPLCKDLKELIDEGVLDPGKIKSNSKKYKLTLIHDNPLVIVPRDLEILYNKFYDFVRVITQLYKDPNLVKKPIKTFPLRGEIDLAYKSIPVLPYDIIEIIERIYNFYFTFVLPIKIKDKDVIIRLYSSYLGMILKMRLLVTQKINYTDSIKNFTNLFESPMYEGYIRSDIFRAIEKVAYIRRDCIILGIEKSLLEVLHFLWAANKEFLPLVYDLHDSVSDVAVQIDLKQSGKTLADYYEYDEKYLKILHIYMDAYASELLKSTGYW